MKFLKVGRVAIITRGRYAGKKVRKPVSTSTTVLHESSKDADIDTETNEIDGR